MRYGTVEVKSITEDLDTRFAKALVRLLQYFNILEENVGLCISHLANPSNPKNSYPSLSKMTAEKKMDWLRELFETKEIISEKETITEFEVWYERATRARVLRNRYIHGYWECNPRCSEKPVSVRAPVWMKEKLGGNTLESMSMNELEMAADELESIFNEFREIRRKHRV